jgi:hypothetical protein
VPVITGDCQSILFKRRMFSETIVAAHYGSSNSVSQQRAGSAQHKQLNRGTRLLATVCLRVFQFASCNYVQLCLPNYSICGKQWVVTPDQPAVVSALDFLVTSSNIFHFIYYCLFSCALAVSVACWITCTHSAFLAAYCLTQMGA